MKLYPENTLIIGDTHSPFEHKNYLEFCLEIGRRVKCGTVIHIGDLVDNHSISYHEHDPNGWSPMHEMQETDKHLADWFKAFPKVKLCRGNHDHLVDRKGKTAGLPQRAFKPYREIWNLPDGWEDDFSFTIGECRYTHGTQYSGRYGHVVAAQDSTTSVVIGHLHSVGGVQYIDTETTPKFGMCVGSGIDVKKYAFAYGKDFRYRPILGCGVTTDNGKYAQFFPMFNEASI